MHARSLETAIAELQSLLGARVSTALAQREHHSRGESYHPPGLPDVVCFPQSTEEVSEVMKISAKYQMPVVPFGAGTSLEGHVHAVRGGISIDMREMNRILKVRAEDSDATLQAGVDRLQLNRAFKNTRLTVFVDSGADANIGGMAATR